jgi:hypothetical protein
MVEKRVGAFTAFLDALKDNNYSVSKLYKDVCVLLKTGSTGTHVFLDSNPYFVFNPTSVINSKSIINTPVSSKRQRSRLE